LDDMLPVYLVENNMSKYEELDFIFCSPLILEKKSVNVYFCFLEKTLAKIVGSYE